MTHVTGHSVCRPLGAKSGGAAGPGEPCGRPLKSLAVLLAVFASACSYTTAPPTNIRDEMTGVPGPDATVYEFTNSEYFEQQPGGVFVVRPAYQNTIGVICDTGWGRSCGLGVGLPKGAACSCKSAWGPVPGHVS